MLVSYFNVPHVFISELFRQQDRLTKWKGDESKTFAFNSAIDQLASPNLA